MSPLRHFTAANAVSASLANLASAPVVIMIDTNQDEANWLH